MKIGDKIIVVGDFSDPSSIREYTISKVHEDTIECGSRECTFYKMFCWPIEVKNLLIEIITERQQLKKIYEESISKIYELSNRINYQ